MRSHRHLLAYRIRFRPRPRGAVEEWVRHFRNEDEAQAEATQLVERATLGRGVLLSVARALCATPGCREETTAGETYCHACDLRNRLNPGDPSNR